MRNTHQTKALNEAILLLKQKQSTQWVELTDQFKITYESLRPLNLIKNTMQEVTTSPEIKGNVLSSVVAIAGGYLSKKVLFKHSANPLKRLAGTLFQAAVTNVISNNSGSIKTAAANIFSLLQNHRKDSKKGL